MAVRRCYGTEEAIALIIEPGSDSVMSDLEHSDDETDETYILPELENESDCDYVSDESYSCKWRWRVKKPPAGHTEFRGINLAIPQSIFMICVQLIFSSYSGPTTLHRLL